MSAKVCRGACGETKPESAFAWIKKAQRSDSRCYDCQNKAKQKYDRAARARRRAARGLAPVMWWTPARIEELRQIILAGATIEEAAAKTGRTVSAINGARRNYYLPKFACTTQQASKRHASKWSDERLVVVAKLLNRRKSFAQIGARLRQTRSAIAGAVHHNREKINAYRASV